MQTFAQDLPPPPPTSECHHDYRVLYTAINMLEDDILLEIFNCCQLGHKYVWNRQPGYKNSWNDRLGLCKLSHVCRRWRYLIHSSSSHLGTHIMCTNGSPIVDTLDHLPPLPLFIDYLDQRAQSIGFWERRAISSEDELGIYHALRLHDRVRRIELCVSPPTLDKSLRFVDKPFPILEHLSLSSTGDDTSLTSLKIGPLFLAPNLRYLYLQGIRLPKRLQLLSSTLSLVTLKLTNIQACGYIRPRLLAARLESLSQLKELSIGFSIPIPRPSVEGLLLGKQGTPVILSHLKYFTFRGVSAYLEHLISQIRAPVLRTLDVILFNQLAFTLTHLSQFVNNTEQIKFRRSASIEFSPGSAIFLGPGDGYPGFTLRVICKPFDWQIDCAAQICIALMSALSGIEKLRLNYSGPWRATSDLDEIQDGIDHTTDDTTWPELLRLFVSVKELLIKQHLSVVLSRVLEVDEIGLDPGLLPDLQELVSECYEEDGDSLFGSFIHARQVAGRPVSFRLLPPSLPTPSLSIATSE